MFISSSLYCMLCWNVSFGYGRVLLPGDRKHSTPKKAKIFPGALWVPDVWRVMDSKPQAENGPRLHTGDKEDYV